jgi:hypothetical protein
MMKTWGLWRWSPAPRKWLGDIQLPWSYLAAEPLEGGSPKRGVSPIRGFTMQAISRDVYDVPIREGLDILEHELSRAKIPTDGHVRDAAIGAMRTLRIAITHHVGRIPGGRRTRESLYWLVPPLYRFADLDKHFAPAQVAELVGPAQFYVNAEIYEAAGELLQGDVMRAEQVVISAQDILYPGHEGPTEEMRAFVLTALDSFLERREIDPRFNPGPHGMLATNAKTR